MTEPVSVCDPAVGGGAFLLAAGRWLERRGLDRASIVRRHLWGADVDPEALAVTAEVLRRWTGEVGEPVTPGDHLVRGDSLLDDDLGRAGPPDGVDLVVGNPPFLGQLGRDTVRPLEETTRLRARFGDAVQPYTDAAALFLLAAMELVRPGGRVALILPESFLAARDAAGVRAEVRRRADLDGLWTAGEPVFADAAVDVCAPVLLRRSSEAPTVGSPLLRRAVGAAFGPVPAVTPDDEWRADERAGWAVLAVQGTGDAPHVTLAADRTLGEMAEASAGFRDQYYALDGLVVDDVDGRHDGDPAWSDLVTSGLIDPAVCRWGQVPARFRRRSWVRPRVDLARLRAEHPAVGRWADARLVPKVVVATQTRVVEAAVDVEGRWYPSTPIVAVVAPPADLWRVAAVLLAPATTAWARARVAGAGLARGAIKLAATDVEAMPLPVDEQAWQEGADLLRGAVEEARRGGGEPDLAPFAEAMGRAYDVEPAVAAWWAARRARRRPRSQLDGGDRT